MTFGSLKVVESLWPEDKTSDAAKQWAQLRTDSSRAIANFIRTDLAHRLLNEQIGVAAFLGVQRCRPFDEPGLQLGVEEAVAQDEADTEVLRWRL